MIISDVAVGFSLYLNVCGSPGKRLSVESVPWEDPKSRAEVSVATPFGFITCGATATPVSQSVNKC